MNVEDPRKLKHVVVICVKMDRMCSNLVAMLSTVRSSGVNDMSRKFVNVWTMWWGKEWRKMIHASAVVMGGG